MVLYLITLLERKLIPWWKKKLDGQGETSVSTHIVQFYSKCLYQRITHEGIICNLFTLTFQGWVKNGMKLFQPLRFTPGNILCMFSCMHSRIIIVNICEEILRFVRKKDESLKGFSLRFTHHIHIFCLDNFIFVKEWILSITSLDSE